MEVQRYRLGEIFYEIWPSTVFLGKNLVLGNDVLVRRLSVDPDRRDAQRETFFREQRHVAGLQHPRILATLDAFEEEGHLWSVHPYDPCRPTTALIAQRGPFSLAEAARVAAQVADGLAYLHGRRHVHGRLSPSAVLIDERGDAHLTTFVKSADLAAGIWPLRKSVAGITEFSSPEEVRGEPTTARSDLYSLAACFLYWIHGSDQLAERVAELGRSGATTGDCVAMLAGATPELPAAVADAVCGALEADPEERRGTVASFASVLLEQRRRLMAETPSGFEPGVVLESVGLGEPVVLQGRIGSGRHGIVFRAHRPGRDADLAVKVLKAEFRDDALSRERFVREAQSLAGIAHPHVVKVRGVGTLRGMPYVVMDHLDGPDLGAVLMREGRLAPSRVAALGRDLCDGLAAIHRDGLLHRDIKPQNVILVRDGRPVIMDLGVAKALHEDRLTITGALVGTPLYMSPEQARGRAIGAASDVYALGAVLYECLAGHPPHEAEDLMTLLRALWDTDPEPLPDDVPAPLAELVHELLTKQAERRPSDAAELSERFAALAVGA